MTVGHKQYSHRQYLSDIVLSPSHSQFQVNFTTITRNIPTTANNIILDTHKEVHQEKYPNHDLAEKIITDPFLSLNIANDTEDNQNSEQKITRSPSDGD